MPPSNPGGTRLHPKCAVALEMWYAACHAGAWLRFQKGCPGSTSLTQVTDPNDPLRIAQRALAGESLAAVAAEYGVSRRTRDAFPRPPRWRGASVRVSGYADMRSQGTFERSGSGNQEELAGGVLGLDVPVRGRGLVQGVGAVDEHREGAVGDPAHDLLGASAPLLG